jgi:hypothetical protein
MLLNQAFEESACSVWMIRVAGAIHSPHARTEKDVRLSFPAAASTVS